MRKPRVFVSSTCFDLKQIRRDLKEFIEGSLGYEAVLSEFESFPVNPDQDTIDNSRSAVRDHCDLFVLVIGGRYGTVDQRTGRSITNSELTEARVTGVPIYVFLEKTVEALLPAWRDNPQLTHPSIDDTRVLAFADEIKGSLTWVFPFDSAQDIIRTLRTQWAYLFYDSLEKRRLLAESESAHALGLTGIALEIALRKERAWEYRLFEALLSQELQKNSQLRQDVRLGFATSLTGRYGDAYEFVSWMEAKFSAGQKVISAWNRVMETLDTAFGPPGVAGDLHQIVYLASRLGAIYEAALRWSLEFHQVQVIEDLEGVREAASHYLDDVPASFDRALHDIRDFLEDFESTYQPGQRKEYELLWSVNVSVEVEERFIKEFDEVKKKYPPRG